jgi:hypothetical protein
LVDPTDKGLHVNFSNLKYLDVAPRVGLKLELAGSDMTTFEIHRARIPTSLFGRIIDDLQVVMKRYGEPTPNKKGECLRYLAPVRA